LAAMIVSVVKVDSVESIAIVELAYVNARAGRPARDKRGQGHLGQVCLRTTRSHIVASVLFGVG
jgi:hypothetical protein